MHDCTMNENAYEEHISALNTKKALRKRYQSKLIKFHRNYIVEHSLRVGKILTQETARRFRCSVEHRCVSLSVNLVGRLGSWSTSTQRFRAADSCDGA